MAYEPKEWACGDVVTADALNNIEQGIADAGVEVSKIKIATVQGGGGPIGTGTQRLFSGMGLLDDNKTLYDLVEDKTIIGLAFTAHLSSSAAESQGTATAAGAFGCCVKAQGADKANLDPRLVDQSYRQECTLINVEGMVRDETTSVEVYAICV